MDDVTVEVRGLGEARCAGGHVTVVPSDPLGACRAAIGDQVTMASPGGRLRRRPDACGDCGAPLTLPARQSELPVPFRADEAVVTVVLYAPLARCPACGRQQLPVDAARLVDAALVAALDAMPAPGG